MTNWDRRATDELAEALGKHIARHPDMPEVNADLVRLHRAVDEASHTVQTTQADLDHFRSQVCAICRGAQLYACDVPHGWSRRCVFVRSNTTQFGDLVPQ